MAFPKTFILALAATICSCEPPVHSSQSGYNYQAPYNSHNAHSPPRYPSSGFNAPSHNFNTPGTGFAPPAAGFAPSASGFAPPATGFIPPAPEYGTPPFSHGTQNGYDNGHHEHSYDNEPKSYEFGYTVKDAASGNDYGRREVSDGDTVRGEYRVALPDGRTQIVTYHADWRSGYHADVRYEGEAHYPEQHRQHVQQQRPGAVGYNYNVPTFGGSLAGFSGNRQAYRPSHYEPSGYH